ncbi:hypothetical protein GIB67_040538 [Kingdonia uniflora]|uniref:Uncharacterized protein n=1 Tax=Kingdonia uniflora TaxID=39325 RepID=A0A7J7L5F2_9MAGN|nr:hypothetical protein GIB67_040538 [Kingdonia uniflora]
MEIIGEGNNTSEISNNSLYVHKMLPISIGDLNRKRKSQSEQLNSPLRKHNFREHGSSSELQSSIAKDQNLNTLLVSTLKHKVEEECTDEGLESGKDSNSCVGESDTAMSPNPESKCPPEYPTAAYIYERTSTSSGSCSSSSFNNVMYSLDRSISSTKTDQTIEKELFGSEKYTDDICTEYENLDTEEYSDPGCEDMMLYSNSVTPNMYVMSSGRRTVNQDTQLSARKPTIDQEFEQYFSKLML